MLRCVCARALISVVCLAAYFVWDFFYCAWCDRQIILRFQAECQKLRDEAAKKGPEAVSALKLPKSPKAVGGLEFALHHVMGAVGQVMTLYYRQVPFHYAVFMISEITVRHVFPVGSRCCICCLAPVY
jgi:hypothetical protein